MNSSPYYGTTSSGCREKKKEICRLYKTNTIRFIRKSDIPPGRKATYGPFVVDIKEHTEERERTRLTVGGDQIEYPGDKSTRTEGLTTAKYLINSVISTKGARFLVVDLKNFYLNTPSEDLNIWSSISPLSLGRLSMNLDYWSWHTTAVYTYKLRNGCMASLQRASSLTNYYNDD
jgi:hypothetical protein